MEIMLKMGLLLMTKLLKETEDGVFANEMPRTEKKRRVGTFNLSVVQGVLFLHYNFASFARTLAIVDHGVEIILVGFQVINTGMLL